MPIGRSLLKMVKLKRSPKNLELDINVAKTGNSVVFRGKQQILQQKANSAARCENPRGHGILLAQS